MAVRLRWTVGSRSKTSAAKTSAAKAIAAKAIASLLVICSCFLTSGVLEIAAQSPSSAAITLSEDSASESQLAAVRADLVSAITQGASPQEINSLLQRRQRIDDALKHELDLIRAELAEIQRASFDPAEQPRRRELRRKQSLLWISRVELATLASELFAEGSAEGLAMARRSIELIEQAIAVVPGAGMVHEELIRLLCEAQLRGGDAEAALRTMHQAARDSDVSPTASQAGKNQETLAAELVVPTPDQLALVIRVELAKHRWEAAKVALDRFYGPAPETARPSTAMDLARLQYLVEKPQQASSSIEIGNWLDAIERRSGERARRNAETMMARQREFRGELLANPTATSPARTVDEAAPPTTDSLTTDSPAIDPPTTDPRVMRADARYYLRVGKAIPAALLFARASIADEDEDRSIDSALRSAAILQNDAKRPAAAQLLQQTAARYAQHASAPTLMLQAAALLSDQEQQSSAEEVLLELLRRWPASNAATTARDTLIAAAESRGQFVEAAELATDLPPEHWSEAAAARCRGLWQRAIVPAASASSCHWHDQECLRLAEESLAARLKKMRAAFASVSASPSPSPLAVQTGYACCILLDDLAKPSDIDDPLALAAQKIEHEVLRALARQRLSVSNQSSALENLQVTDQNLHAAVLWRLNRDLTNNPVLHRGTASLLLAMTENAPPTDPISRVPWLIWSGQAQQGVAELRTALKTSERPGDLLAAAASALADSPRRGDLSQASDLWDELARGIPTSHRSHRRAKVESIVCQWRSGDQAGARSAAKLMLLTNPPRDQSLLTRLQELTATY